MDTTPILPEEIILKILTHLPAKTLHRFKCVSKHWQSLITSPHFLSAYSSLSPHPSSWILVDRAGRFSPGPSPSPNLSFSLSQPPNITYLTLSGLPSRLTKTGRPTVLTSSNGLILCALAPSNQLYICNPVTRDWAPLPVPNCGKITTLPRVALAAKFTPTCDDVSLVVIEFQAVPGGGGKLLRYRSATGQWEAKRTKFRAGSGINHTCTESFEVNGKLFWLEFVKGLVVLDDPFGERLELRFIPSPPDVGDNDNTVGARFIFPVRGFVQCFVIKERDLRIWKLNDVEGGRWGVLYEIAVQRWLELDRLGFVGLGLSAFHPLDVNLAVMKGEDKVVMIDFRSGAVVEIVSYPKTAETREFHFPIVPVVLPALPMPLPLSLRAISAKENGNIYFKNKNFKEALVYYSRSISCQPTAIAYANRAAANFELGKYQEAEMDLSEASKIDDRGCTFPFTVFPDELILEILIRLTPKSICRLKCLSKAWLSFISSYRFLSAYTFLSPQPSSWILVDRDGRFSQGPSPDLSFSPTQPPNITYLTLSGLPSRLTKPCPPTIITSSNGLILFALTPSNLLYICNPVTRDWAPLPVPDCGKITTLPRVALAAKFTPTGDVVSLVVTEFQSSLTVATLLTYRSATGQWEVKPAKFRSGSKAHHTCSADGSFEVDGKVFWIDLSCGLVVLDDPFGERVELRFIPLPPKGPTKSPRSRFVFPVGGFVQCMVRRKGDCRIWRLKDVDKGEWGLLYKIDNLDARLRENGLPIIRGFGLSAFHPLDFDYSYWTGEDKVVVVNMLKVEVVDIALYPKNAEMQGSYTPIVLPTWPTPLPLSLGATSAKERGNVFFREKKFRDSIFHYSRSIYLLPTAVAYTNRAAANFQLGKYQEAENDCSEAIRIDDQYLKVYVYRANARKKLGKLREAKEDAQIALKLDPGHQEILMLFAEINRSLEKGVCREG